MSATENEGPQSQPTLSPVGPSQPVSDNSTPRVGDSSKSDGPPATNSPQSPGGIDVPQCLNGALRCAGTVLLSLYLVTLYGALIYIEFGLWQSAGDQLQPNMTIVLPWLESVSVSSNTWLLFLVLTTGAIGSFIHAATSFADFVGNQQARRSWTIWFILRPLIGSALALVFYLTLRGGLFGSASEAKTLNIFGFAAIAALSGMFSKQATDKLSEVFDTLFKTSKDQGDDARGGKLNTSQTPSR